MAAMPIYPHFLPRDPENEFQFALKRDGFVDLAPNPHHQRAPLVTLTENGSAAYAATTNRPSPVMLTAQATPGTARFQRG